MINIKGGVLMDSAFVIDVLLFYNIQLLIML